MEEARKEELQVIDDPLGCSAKWTRKMGRRLLVFEGNLSQSTVIGATFPRLLDVLERDVLWAFPLVVCLPASNSEPEEHGEQRTEMTSL